MFRNVNRKQAMSMLLTGEPITASEAKEIGLINGYYPSEIELNEQVLCLADKIASKSTATIQLGKRTFYRQHNMPLRDAYKFTETTMTKNLMFEDAKEGISAFLQRRAPNWKNS